jgi:hypothetical protein
LLPRAEANPASVNNPKSSRVISIPVPSGGRRSLPTTALGAAVVTVTVIETDPKAPGVAEGGLTEQVASEGAPVQLKLMVCVSPPNPLKLSE